MAAARATDGARRSPSEGASGTEARDNAPAHSPQYEKNRRGEDTRTTPVDNPPLPYDEEVPPLPTDAPPHGDDGWEAKYDDNMQAWYFCNRFTGASQWENPRVPEANVSTSYASYDRSTVNAAPGTYTNTGAPGTTSSYVAPGPSSPPKRVAGGYNPAIHGSYDPNADYAVEARQQEEEDEATAAALATGVPGPNHEYGATGHFNRFTGRFQAASINPDNHNDAAKSHRQMSAYFDVDAAANSHDGRSLKAERRNKTLTKKELKAFKNKRKAKKDEKRRAWLRD